MLIYLLTNKLSGKQYVGQTTKTLSKRTQGHRWLSSATNKNMAIAHAIQKYGWENFEARVLEECQTLQELNDREVHFVATLGTMAPNGYNLRAGGGGTGTMATEVRNKIRKALVGRQATAETRRRLSESHLGFSPSEATCEKLRQINKGRKASPQAYAASVLRNAKTYTLVSPEGSVLVVTNLKEFCRERGLPYIDLHDVTSGRSGTYKGWKLEIPIPKPPVKRPRAGKTYILVDPEGVSHTTNLLPTFCKEHGLNYTAIFDVIGGRKPTHKGWKALAA